MINRKDLMDKYPMQFNFYITEPLKANESPEEAEKERFLFSDEVKVYKTDKFECYRTGSLISKPMIGEKFK